MSVRLGWTPKALIDLRRLHRFLSPKSPRAADRAIVTIRNAVNLLRDFPEAGRVAEDSEIAHRELIVPFGDGGYVVAYVLLEGSVAILDVRHQREAGY